MMKEKKIQACYVIFVCFAMTVPISKCIDENESLKLTDTPTPSLSNSIKMSAENQPCEAIAAAQFVVPSATKVYSKQGYNLLIRGMSCTCDLHFPEGQRRDDYQYTTGIGGHKFHGRSATFNEARKICEREGGHLAIIDSDAEARILSDLSTRSDSISWASYDGAAWIGIHDLYAEGEWLTIFNDPVDTRGYNRWDKGQPDNHLGLEHCGCLLFKKSPATLADLPCRNFTLPFWCEIPEVHMV